MAFLGGNLVAGALSVDVDGMKEEAVGLVTILSVVIFWVVVILSVVMGLE